MSITKFYGIFFNPHLRTCLLILEAGEGRAGGREKYGVGREGGGERDTSILCLSYAPNWVSNLNLARYVL